MSDIQPRLFCIRKQYLSVITNKKRQPRMLPNTRTLIKVAAIGGIMTCSMGMLMQWKVKDRVRQADYYKEAFKILRTHHGAPGLLGEPIKEGNLDLKNKENYCDKLNARFEVPVKGTKQKGVLYFWANRNNESEKWNVDRVELDLENEPDRRLLIKFVAE